MTEDQNGTTFAGSTNGDAENTSKIIDVDIENEMKNSFLDYSMSVIVSRALPDVRDGLKPVHRRILYTLFEDGLTPDKAYRKCANTVGLVLGRYHPHGDGSVYEALVRMAQDFSMRYILVDGHGNFGSIDGDPPAAYRYTEARMSKISVEMLLDIDKNTVDFVPNYDERLKMPSVLPSRYPNLLVNGSTGIAVGMATNIPPHNLREVIDAVCFLIDNPEAEINDLLAYIKGPDFPTGGIIMGFSGIRAAYATGRGKVTVRAKTEILEESNGRFKIVVTEIPYQVNKARLIENIAELVKDKRIEGISNINDHSDRNGMHIQIDLKRDASPQIVLNQLFSFSQLQTTFGIIMLAIVDGEPKVLTLKEMLNHYINFQQEVITRRTTFELKKAQDRAHILEGLRIALDNIDEVIKILRSSKSISEGRAQLSSRFGLDDIQTQAIVQMPLGRLTGLEREKIDQELAALSAKIKDLLDILGDNKRILEIIKTELVQIKNKFGDERRTELTAVSGEVDIESLIPNEKCIFTMTHLGYLKRQKMDIYKIQNRGGRGVLGMSRREEDFARKILITNSHDFVLFFTNFGRVYKLKCYEIPEGSRTSKGMNFANLLPITGDEKITSVITLSEFENDKFLIMVTKFGVVKRVKLEAFSNVRRMGIIALDLDENDELCWTGITDGNQEVLVATKNGKAVRFKERDVRVVGRSARGVIALRMTDNDAVAGVVVPREGSKILTVSETGFGRISGIEDYRIISRGGKGVINYHVEKYGKVASINIVEKNEDVVIISSDGIIIRIAADSISEVSRPGKGVIVMRVTKENKVVGVATLPHEDEICEAAEENQEDSQTEEQNTAD